MISGLLVNNILVYIKIILYIIFILMSAFFAGIETALMKYTAGKTGVDEGIKKWLIFWEAQPELILGTILVGTNLACVGIGVLNVSLGLWTGLSIILLLVFGEIIPKILALYYPQRIVSSGLGLLVRFTKVFAPVAKVLGNISIYFSKIFFGEQQEPLFFTKYEIEELLSKGEILQDGKEMYVKMLELAERRIYEVMIPKEEIVAVEIKSSLDEIIERIRNIKYSRVPVYRDNIDNIIGIIYTKDLIVAMQNKELIILDDLIRQAYFVIDTARVVDVLKKFKQGQHHLAIVVNEYGSTVGLVTIEDIIEELVGEIYDEYDLKEINIRKVNGESLIVKGDENITTIEQIFGVKFSDEEVATIGGYVMTKLGSVPKIGEKFVFGNVEVEILNATEKVIKTVKVRKL
ncbi:MAG: hemolysin family protein [Endomicrobia bacterium]|nr:hemolysin family protein [Endomicrobiia bacterium]MDW8055830.1 hemolysin family protein [Elusimicrobiota bacterium]